MSPEDKPRWSLPYCSPLPEDPRLAGRMRGLRIAAYVLVAVALITPVVQIQAITLRNMRRAETFDRLKDQGKLSEKRLQRGRPKPHKGAIARWSKAVRQMWEGVNIYKMPPAPGEPPRELPPQAAEELDEAERNPVGLHPNMPFVVVLLTPFAMLPVEYAALVFSILKGLAIAAAVYWLAAAGNHKDKRMGDWVIGLALLWSLLLIVGDIQHGNTNGFVLAFLAMHLFLYRRGHDWAAGVPLALAICIKMTPALFVLYWLYQRNWRLLGGTLISGLVMAIGIPAVALGPERFVELGSTWMQNLIIPGLVEGAWYPIHINQSIPGVFSRYFLDGQNGDIFWNADDDPYYLRHGGAAWITLVSLGEQTVRWLIKAAQLLTVGVMAWAIGWRKLPRDDGRRMMHYGLVVLGMMLLNQRTWDHHAAVLLIANVGIWYALAYGRMGRRTRQVALFVMLAAGPMVWLMGTGTFHAIAKVTGHSRDTADTWADYMKAYGPTFWHFVLLTTASVICLRSLRGKDDPYSDTRRPVFAKESTPQR
ncbi:MAG: glycosyltransferase family 87 protein [Phycisphaerae bacterium]